MNILLGAFLLLIARLLISPFLLDLRTRATKSSSSGFLPKFANKVIVFLLIVFSHSLPLKVVFATGVVYAAGDAMASSVPCYGWDCDVVKCRDGYAVYIPELKKYLPCEKFDEFIETDNEELLR